MLLRRPDGHIDVHPVPEYAADAELTAVYRDVTRTLRVPWVGVIVQAIAHYRPFFFEAWRLLAPSAETDAFEAAASSLAGIASREIASLHVPPQAATLTRIGYAERELDQIAATLNVFEYGNPKYLIVATAIMNALNGDCSPGTLSRNTPHRVVPELPDHSAGSAPPMVEEHHALGDLKALYADMKRSLELPFVNSDYKALARWPSYLDVAWQQLKPLLAEPRYQQARQQIHDTAVEAARNLAYPYDLDARRAIAIGLPTSQVDEVSRTIALFQWLLSGLILNVAFFKRGLVEPWP